MKPTCRSLWPHYALRQFRYSRRGLKLVVVDYRLTSGRSFHRPSGYQRTADPAAIQWQRFVRFFVKRLRITLSWPGTGHECNVMAPALPPAACPDVRHHQRHPPEDRPAVVSGMHSLLPAVTKPDRKTRQSDRLADHPSLPLLDAVLRPRPSQYFHLLHATAERLCRYWRQTLPGRRTARWVLCSPAMLQRTCPLSPVSPGPMTATAMVVRLRSLRLEHALRLTQSAS
jgi:hypothetical protein